MSPPSSTTYPRLFAPLRMRHLTLRNRVVNLPQGMAYTNRGRVEEEDIEYHRRRAAGGAGLLITGGTAIHGASQTRTRNFVEAYAPDVVDGVRRRSEAVHGEGSHIVGQLFSLGREMAADAMTDVPVAPSAVRAPGVAYAPMAMGEREIGETIESFCRSARHFALGGCDGVEIHAAHGYLLAQFLSPVSNRRSDRYGGDAAGRARFLIETAGAVREAVGDGLVVGVRLSVDDQTPGGTDPEQCQETISQLLAMVDVDYLSLAVGVKGTYVQDSSAAEGVALDRIRQVSAGLTIPTIASQRIRRPQQAEQLIADGVADLVGMARALIADPNWVAKAQRGEDERIRLCVGDMQDCRSHLSGGLRCMINPEVGHELETARLRAIRLPRRTARTVAVVGAGAAGLELARRRAERGDTVTVFEAGSAVGGQLLAAQRAPGRAELADFLAYQCAELGRLGVCLEFGAALADVGGLDADIIVVATGATAAPLPERFTDVPARTVGQVLTGSLAGDLGETVIVDDGTGAWSMLTAAALLASVAASVTIVTPGGAVTAAVPAESVAGLRRRMRTAGIRWLVDTSYVGYEQGRVQLLVGGTGETLQLPATTVVVETGRIPVDRLWRTGQEQRTGVHAIGDALAPRTVGNAVRDAMVLDRRLSSAVIGGARWP